LTDTIILLKANTEKKSINLLSIPRDLYVQYPWDEHFFWKINWVYQRYAYRKDTKYWMQMLGEKITDITWEKIDYYVNVDFKGFIEIIDTIQWIIIEVPEDLIDYEYPDSNRWYRTLIFRKWIWLFDWEDALKYVRSRHSSSDFDRSLRQQQVISAIKDKILSTYLITSPWKIRELYEIFTKNVLTDLPLTKMLSLAYSFRNLSEFSIISANINDSCFYWSYTCSKWWILYVPDRELFNWMSVLLFNWTDISNLSNYELPKKYANITLNYPWIQTENLKVNILNSTKTNNLANTLSNDVMKYWFNVSKLWNTSEELEKTVIYYNNVLENSQTLKALKLFFVWEFIQIDIPKYSQDGANFEIILGKDYLNKENIFKF
jgi:LCP family protein required for cell wall assembly